MITAFPEGLRGALKAAAVKHYGTDADPGEVGDLEEAVLVFLNAALDAGVAREEIIKQSQFYDAKHEIRISLK